MKIRVSNLDRSTSAEELFELFEDFGEVRSAIRQALPDRGKDTYSALVDMAFKADAEEAISELNGEFVDGNHLKVAEATRQEIEFIEVHSEEIEEEGELITFDGEDEAEEEDSVSTSFERIQRRRPLRDKDD